MAGAEAIREKLLIASVFSRLATSAIVLTLRLVWLTKVNALEKFHLILAEFEISLFVGLI
jgi:hypothetical protein